MRAVLWSALAGAGLVLATVAGWSRYDAAYAESGSFYSGDGDVGGIITHFTTTEGRPHSLVVLDQRRQVISVYHIDAGTGEITLKSVRNFAWDLQMIDFNSGDPLPQDVRSGLGH
jgi:hypothetical protein